MEITSEMRSDRSAKNEVCDLQTRMSMKKRSLSRTRSYVQRAHKTPRELAVLKCVIYSCLH